MVRLMNRITRAAAVVLFVAASAVYAIVNRWQIVKEGPQAYKLDRWTGEMQDVSTTPAPALVEDSWDRLSENEFGKVRIIEAYEIAYIKGFCVKLYNGNERPIAAGHFMVGEGASAREVRCTPIVKIGPFSEGACVLHVSDNKLFKPSGIRLERAVIKPDDK